MPIQFGDPDFGQLFRLLRRQVPSQLRACGFERQAGFCARYQRREETVREKMHVRVGDRQRTPGRLRVPASRAVTGRAPGELGEARSKARAASEPATLFTPSFLIMVLR